MVVGLEGLEGELLQVQVGVWVKGVEIMGVREEGGEGEGLVGVEEGGVEVVRFGWSIWAVGCKKVDSSLGVPAVHRSSLSLTLVSWV